MRTKKPETNISKCLWYKVQLFGVTLVAGGFSHATQRACITSHASMALVSPPLATSTCYPLKGSTTSNVSCSLNWSCFNWFWIYSWIAFAFLPAVST